MNDPSCPACRSELTFRHAMSMRNPWRYRCPECSEALDAGLAHKVAAVALPPAAAAVVAAAATLERLQVLNAPASFTFLAACALATLAATVWLWRRTTFKRKRG